MKKIKFYDIKSQKGSITFKVESKEDYEKPVDIYFKFNRRIKAYNDQIAYLISTLCGREYENIEIDLEITKEIKKNLENFTKAKVKANIVDSIKIPDRSKYKNIALSFSGGFDSLTAKYLMPKNIKLVSVNFGEWFERENNFFKKFHPYTTDTNIRRSNINLNKNSWTFMGCSCIIYCDYLKIKYNIFGTALEDSLYQLRKNTSSFDCQATEPFEYLGEKEIRVVNGLGAIATAKIILRNYPYYVNDTLLSIAAAHDEKRYRKQTILDILCKKENIKVDFEHVEPPKEKVEWGKLYFVDFLMPYLIKNIGLKETEKYITGIPKELIELIKDMKLDFYERVDTNSLTGTSIPEGKIKIHVMNKLAESGILPYDENDFEEFRKIVDFIIKPYDEKKTN